MNWENIWMGFFVWEFEIRDCANSKNLIKKCPENHPEEAEELSIKVAKYFKAHINCSQLSYRNADVKFQKKYEKEMNEYKELYQQEKEISYGLAKRYTQCTNINDRLLRENFGYRMEIKTMQEKEERKKKQENRLNKKIKLLRQKKQELIDEIKNLEVDKTLIIYEKIIPVQSFAIPDLEREPDETSSMDGNDCEDREEDPNPKPRKKAKLNLKKEEKWWRKMMKRN